MTVSLPKPNWRSLKELGDRSVTALTEQRARIAALRATRAQAGSVGDDSSVAEKATQRAKQLEWSAVMRSRATAAKASARPAAKLTPVKVSRRSMRGEVSTAWVLPSLVLVLCLISVAWFFAHGTAATAWLIALLAVAFVGSPLVLLALKLLGYEDPD